MNTRDNFSLNKLAFLQGRLSYNTYFKTSLSLLFGLFSALVQVFGMEGVRVAALTFICQSQLN